jgi:serine/threonine protein kinase
MSFKEEIDFLKYGLNWKIPANAKSMPDNFKTNVSSVKRNDKTLVFTKPTGEVVNIILKDALGHGSYGETWTTDTRFDKDIEMVVKIIAYSEGDDTSDVEYDTIQEALIQIIIYECSKDFKDLSLNLIGPFCPKFYLLGRAGRTMFIVMERVTTSLDTILINNSKNPTKRASWKPPTAEFVRQIILQLTIILKQLYIKVGYNHRDLKPDNIMFNIVNGKPNLKLIDFGFS